MASQYQIIGSDREYIKFFPDTGEAWVMVAEEVNDEETYFWKKVEEKK